MEPLDPTYTAPLFRPLHAEVLSVLRSMREDDWQRPTLAPHWRVRDVAAHLFDTAIRRISTQRDGHRLVTSSHGSKSVLQLINELNASGVEFARRLSPALLIDLLALSGDALSTLVEGLNPEDAAPFSVLWAGEQRSANWMDIGREYTERWHHQMQIRDAVGAPLLLEPRWTTPMLEISMRVLPHAYAGVDASSGTCMNVEITSHLPGASDLRYTLARAEDGWTLYRGGVSNAAATVQMDVDTAWRLFFNALARDDAAARVTRRGENRLTEPILAARAIMV
jgi:uncharacterized protein (TIGR03083 family)